MVLRNLNAFSKLSKKKLIKNSEKTKEKFFSLFLSSWLHVLNSFSIFSDEFRSKVACENDVVQLKCNPHSRIAIYSASFGRTEYESVQCPQPQGVPEESK